jgi:transcriptional regulator with XRE-family HTH domain
MKALKRHLKRKRMTQSEFAALMGVSQPTVTYWLNGSKTPTSDKLVRIADLTGLTVDELLGRRAA